MQDLLFHPAVQAAVIPFIVSAILTVALIKIRINISAIVLLVGFMTTCILITDISLQPLTSTKKLMLLTLFSAFWGLILQFRLLKNGQLLILISTISLLACSWLLWPVLSRKETLDAVIMVLPLSFYCILIVSLTILQTTSTISKPSKIEIHIIAIIFATVTSVSCVIAASALYGQMVASLAASAAGLLGVGILIGQSVIKPRNDSSEVNYLFTILLYFPVGLIAVAATIYANLPWYVLPCLAAIPAILHIKVSDSYLAWQRLGIRVGISMLPSAMALYFTWDAAGPVLY